MKKQEKNGFTLIELLVVISTIALLLAILLPALSRARHVARRAVCASHIKDTIIALSAYAANENDGLLTRGAMGKGENIYAYMRGLGWSQLDYITGTEYEPLKKYLKDTKTLMCTNFKKRYRYDSEWKDGEPFIPSWNLGTTWENVYWIGYNYLGGHFAEAWPDPGSGVEKWKSPYRLTDSGKLPLLCCQVSQSSKEPWKTFIAHSGRGPIEAPPNTDPKEIAPNGSGNLGKLDGSVSSQAVRDMKKHPAKIEYTDYGDPLVFGYW